LQRFEREGSAGTGSTLPASRFRRRSGIPSLTAGREPSLATAPLLASRPLQGTPKDRRRPSPAADLRRRRPRLLDGTGFTLLGFAPLQRIRSRGFGPRGLAMPATFRPRRFSRPRRFTPRNTCPGLFHPGNARGVSPSRLRSSPGIGTCLQAPVLSCRSSPIARAVKRDRPERSSRALLPPKSPYTPRSENLRRPLPSWRWSL
jgi:hypothetical protein